MKILSWIVAAGAVTGACAMAEDVPGYLRHAHATILEPFVDGVALEVPEAVAAQPSAAAGFIDVTRPPFGADPTGAADCTGALQKAIDFARDRQMVCFFPPGTYRVSDTLSCVRQLYRRKNGRVSGAFYHPCVIEGSRAGASRPRILLAPRSPGFDDPERPRHVLHFWARGYANPTTDGKVTDGRGVDEDQPNISMNQRLVNLEIVIGEGNPGAVGLRHQAAEGSAIEDCRIDATHGFAGIEGGIGSGGSSAGVTVVGGRYGLDFRTSQPTPVITGFTLASQTVSAIRYSGRQTLVAAGLRIDASLCAGPAVDANGGEGKLFLQGPNQKMQGQVCLVDSVIDFRPSGGTCDARATAIRSSRSLYLNNVYVRGAGAIAANPEDGFSLAARPEGWTHVGEFARGPAVPAAGGKPGVPDYRFPIWIDGARRESPEVRISAGSPPADLQSRHLWPAAFPHREWPDAVNVKDAPYGAKGDGRADDTDAIQRAVNAADVVFLPKGYFRITRPIDLRPGTRLVGAAQHLSILVATGPEGAFADPANPAPLVRSADDAAGDAILAHCGLWAPRNLDGARCLHWRSGAKSVVRGVLFLHAPLYATPLKRGEAPAARATASILVTGHGGGRWYNIFDGGEHPQAPGYRHLLVEGAAGPLSIYQLSPQHVVSDAAVEIRGARNVSFFGVKYEGNSPVVWVRDSDRVRIFGHGGNGKGAEGRSLYRVERTPNFLVANAVEGPTRTGMTTLSGFSTDPQKWFMIVERPASGPETRTLPFDRPVLYRRGPPD